MSTTPPVAPEPGARSSLAAERGDGACVQDLEASVERLERELTAAKAERDDARASSQAKTLLMAELGHEIRNPVMGIMGIASLMLEIEGDPALERYAKVVLDSANALLTLVNASLDYHKLEANKLELESIDFDLDHVVGGAMDLVAPRARGKEIEIASTLPPTVPRNLRGDPARLRQVLLNLLNNALKFTAKGHIALEVTRVSEDADGLLLRFEVTDSGIGIPPEVRAKLFTDFAQGDPSIARRFGGTGLGLAICKRLVALMGGEIGVDSAPGGGSRFWFTAHFERPLAAQLPAGNAEELVSGLSIAIRGERSNETVALKELLEGLGARVVMAETPARASAFKIDVVIVDESAAALIDVGLEHADFIGEGGPRPEFVLVARPGVRGDAARARAVGYSAYITKPLNPALMFDCLAELAHRRRWAAMDPTGSAEHPLITAHMLMETFGRRGRAPDDDSR
ncbi:MAG TPA: ATP-binding protein [Alphaproteobacteria bacterium]|nr:ATP-binding protein [Alphaproteobacteria bacterium]